MSGVMSNAALFSDGVVVGLRTGQLRNHLYEAIDLSGLLSVDRVARGGNQCLPDMI